MATRFVEVDRSRFCEALEARGFTQDIDAQGELVYVRQHHLDKTMFVKIYTSLPQNGGDTRGVGQDAIRVLLMFKNGRTQKTGCLYKASRVYRTGSEAAVIERTLERAREAYKVGIDRVRARLPGI
jgi:hypothetical protein